jgi:hypothetical protein
VIRKDDGPVDSSPLSSIVDVKQQITTGEMGGEVVPAGTPMLKS